jgi:hypothetical protein
MLDSSNTFRLKHVDGRGRVSELAMNEMALVQEIIGGDSIGPEALVCLEDRWVPLTDFPNPPWLDPLAQQAIQAAESCDSGRAERVADKILHYGMNSDAEAVRIALFLKSHFLMCIGKYRPATELLERAAHPQSSFSPAAHHNRGVAWVHLQHPDAALKEFEWALAEDETFLVASLCLRNLVGALEGEKAPPMPGESSWGEIRRREERRLRQAPEAQLRALLNPRARFPGHPFWHVVGPGPYFPAVSARLPRSPEGQRAALRLLTEANKALADARYHPAHALARAAPAFNPSVRPLADRLAAVAAAKIQEGRLLRTAERTIARLMAFLGDLQNLSLANLDAARESLTLAAPLLKDADLQGLYHERVEQVITEALSRAQGGRRSRLLTVAQSYARLESSDAYQGAAAFCLAGQALQLFWTAVEGGDVEGAVGALNAAAQFLEDNASLKEERAILEKLRLLQPHIST